MWKRDDAANVPSQPGAPPPARPQEPQTKATDRQESSKVNIGKSVIIKGELSGSEDLTIEGQVEGKIELRQNVLTIGPNGRIKAEVNAKAVIIQGEVIGNITATEKVDIRDAGSVDGDLAAPRIAIADGAHFRGSIDMKTAGSGAAAKPSQPAQTPPVPASASAAASATASAATPGQGPQQPSLTIDQKSTAGTAPASTQTTPTGGSQNPTGNR